MNTFTFRLFSVTLAVASAVPSVMGEDIRLPITADSSIAADPSEIHQNAGGATRVKLKGIENFILLNFDASKLEGKLIERADVHICGANSQLMVRKVGISTVATEWNEGTSSYSDAKPGESCFVSPAAGDSSWWAGADSNFLDALWGRGGTMHTQTFVTQDKKQWFTIPVDGRLLELCAAGMSSGLALSDDNGQTKAGHKDVVPDSNFSNNYFYAREQTKSAPYITVSAKPAPAVVAKPLAIVVSPWLSGADADSGALEISWAGPTNEVERNQQIGYRIRIGEGNGPVKELPRWKHPPVAMAGERCRTFLQGFPAEQHVTAEVEIIGRGGVVLAKGKASGKASIKPTYARLVVPAPVAFATGQPPANAAGSVWGMPELAKANPITGAVLEEPGVDYTGDATGSWKTSNPIWSGAKAQVHLGAMRGEWTAFQLVCQNQKPTGSWSVTPSDLKGPKGFVIPASALRLSRLWYQQVGKGAGERDWYADPMLPLNAGEQFSIPDERNAVPGQTNQAVYLEFFVPKTAAPGVYEGVVNVDNGGEKPLSVQIHLTVGDAVMPDEAAFVFSMNAYNTPANGYGDVDSEEFLDAERSFYRMSHEHRTNLAVLGYSHSARFQAGVAWPLAGKGKAMKVSDWSKWDSRFGPYFDGSAFAGMPREGVPMDHFYLPFMESWPTSMADGYRWNDAQWEDHWKVAGMVEDGFTEEYKDQWIAVMRDFRDHAKEKKWKTSFQVYLNDKYFYKQYTPARKSRGDGTSFWLLDEPMHIDDFTALAYFGKLTDEAMEGKRDIVSYRVDVSRPQWGRDSLDRIVDCNVTGGFTNYRPWLEDWRERYGQRIWTYGGAPSSRESAYGIEMKAIDLYSRGVDGFVPWLTIGGDSNWVKFADTCVFYSGKVMGLPGACASLRLKAYRRGEQAIEYVRLLAVKRGLLENDPNRRAVGALLEGALSGTKTLGKLDSQGAVTEAFSNLDVAKFDLLRQTIVTELGK